MMLSVMERQAGLELARCDAFVNVAGGVRVMEPAADLPLVLALASSLTGRPLFADAVAFGEVGLGGEVRTVGRTEERLKEAVKLGFRQAVLPARSARLAEGLGMQAHAVRKLADAVRLLKRE
jgi:DNA repair protein RadA/Sms